MIDFCWSLSDSKSPRNYPIQCSQCWILNGFNFISNLLFFEILLKVLEDYSKGFNYYWYHLHFYALLLFQVLNKLFSSCLLSLSLSGQLEQQSLLYNRFFFLGGGLVFWLGLHESFVSRSFREFLCISFSCFLIYHLLIEIPVSWTIPCRSSPPTCLAVPHLVLLLC